MHCFYMVRAKFQHQLYRCYITWTQQFVLSLFRDNSFIETRSQRKMCIQFKLSTENLEISGLFTLCHTFFSVFLCNIYCGLKSICISFFPTKFTYYSLFIITRAAQSLLHFVVFFLDFSMRA